MAPVIATLESETLRDIAPEPRQPDNKLKPIRNNDLLNIKKRYRTLHFVIRAMSGFICVKFDVEFPRQVIIFSIKSFKYLSADSQFFSNYHKIFLNYNHELLGENLSRS